MKFRPHCPRFVNDGDPIESPQEFASLNELREVPAVARFLARGVQLQLGLIGPDPRMAHEHHLMGVTVAGKYYVIGYLSPDESVRQLGLPIWHPREL